MTQTVPADTARRRRRPALWRRLTLRRPELGLAIGSVLLTVIVLACVAGPWFISTSGDELVSGPLEAPSLAHPFGTDSVGRDIFVRTLEGGRNDLMLVVIIVTTAALIGSAVGVFFASGPRWADTVFMRATDAVIAFPGLVIVMAIAVVLSDLGAVGPLPRGAASALIAIVLLDWPSYARLVRGETLSLSQRDFVKAARLLGYSRMRIVVRHLLPNLAPSILAYMVLDCIVVVAVIAGMPFLGAGIQPPEPEWGSIMISGASLLQSAWWITLLPGAVLVAYGTSLSLIADALSARIEGDR